MTDDRKTVCIVDDNQTNLLMGQKALEAHYRVFTLSAASKLFKLMEKIVPDLILLDVDMPEMDGYEAMAIIKKDPRYSSIPVVFLTAHSDDQDEIKGLSLGAVDYIIKPFSAPVMLKRVENHLRTAEYERNMMELVNQRTAQLERLKDATLDVLAEIVEARDHSTGGHIERTKDYFFILFNEMKTEGLYEDEISTWDPRELEHSVKLHDVGKISVSDVILNKPGKLTDEEFDQIKLHASEGMRLLDEIGKKSGDNSFIKQARLYAGTHHEKWNGTGYPMGLSGEDIPLQGRILAIADVYDALVSARSYKQPMPHSKAVDIIREGSGTQFDPKLVELFLNVADKFSEISSDYLDKDQNKLNANQVAPIPISVPEPELAMTAA